MTVFKYDHFIRCIFVSIIWKLKDIQIIENGIEIKTK